MTTNPHTEDDQRDAVMRFVEQFGLLMNEQGVPRMPSRVFAYILADDAEKYTASDLAEGLQVSPAAISGAVRLLVQIGLVGKEREPGARVDHYRVYDSDVWSAIIEQRTPFIDRTVATLERLVADFDPDRPGAERARETLEYYRFIRREMPELMARWRKHRADNNIGVHHSLDAADLSG